MAEPSDSDEIPRFAHSVFGYDRFQVEEYLGRLHEWALQEQARAVEAERRSDALQEEIRALRSLLGEGSTDPEAVHEHAGAALLRSFDDLSAIRRGAAEESEAALQKAKEEALEIVRCAREMAEQIGAEAEAGREQAERLLADARGQAERILADARGQAERVRAGTGPTATGPETSGSEGAVAANGHRPSLRQPAGDLAAILERLRSLSEDLRALDQTEPADRTGSDPDAEPAPAQL